ncbi:hypothetical protein F4777DRAFT_126672 [Nemania sp. FL0916]|nr:hypothetical protein F4777DRAFT_126672 [Nemania sp. FL0916]
MLPPVDDSVLQKNPRFQKLYNTITTSILNPDGSTRMNTSAKQRDDVRQELKAYRLKAARVQLVRSAISTAIPTQISPSTKLEDEQQQQKQHKQRNQHPPQHRRTQSRSHQQNQTDQPSSLPPDLLELLIHLPPFLNNASTLPPSSVALLLTSSPFTELPALFPKVLGVVSARLASQAKTLARVLSPTTNPSYIHRVIPTLPFIASTLVSDLDASQAKLSRTRLATTAALTRHFGQHAEALALLLRAIEAKHGVVATLSELRATEARQEAQAWALAAEALLWETRGLAYPPEARVALANYRRHLRDAGRRLEDGTRVREVELAEYGVRVDKGADSRPRGRERRGTVTVDENKERALREMARVWREMDTRLREIQGDLSRLR